MKNKLALMMLVMAAAAVPVQHLVRLAPVAYAKTASGADHPDPKESATTVTIDNFSFSPATLTIAAGTTVTWTNKDDIPHNVVEQNRAFKSQGLDTEDKFSHTFDQPGTYEYFCSMHPKMVAKIVVQAGKQQ